MEDLGIRVSGGSDCPVEPFNVLDNLRAAVTRQNRAGTRVYLPEQALTVEQAVRLFTSDAAWASRDEAVRGTLSWASRPTLWCWTGICLKSLTKTLIGLRFWRRC